MTFSRFDARALIDALPEPVTLVSVGGDIGFANRAFATTFGRAPNDLVDRSLTDFVVASSGGLGDFLRLCARSRYPVPTAVRFVGEGVGEDYRVEGARVSVAGDELDWVLLRFTPKTKSSGKFVALNEKIDELNEQVVRRRASERLLREQKEWLHGTLSSIGEGLIATDAEARVRLFNQEAERLTGWSAERATGVLLGDVFHAVDESTGDPDDSPVTEALEHGRVVKRGGRMLTAQDGTVRPIQETAAPIRGENGRPLGAVLVFRDVTRERRTTEEIQRAQEAAEAANRAKSEFLASVSHELRTPMNVVIGMTDLALESDLDAQVRNYLSTGRESANNLLHLLDELLDLSRIEARELVLNERLFRVREIVFETVRVLAAQAAEKELELTCVIQPEVPEALLGDAARLRQILLNVIGNAVKFTSRGEVAVMVDVAERDGDQAEIHFEVRDTGVGIPDADRARIFSPFVQADSSSSRAFGGTGLGLSIVSALIERMDGKLWVESELDRGSTFHFALTYPVESDFDRSAALRVLPHSLAGAPVLVVDDYPTSRRALSSLLASWGMSPTEASSGDEALALLAEAKRDGRCYRLAIVDALMPDKDGRDVIERIDIGETPAVLMASPVDLKNHKERFEPLAVSARVDKPVRPVDLLASIRTALGAEPSGATDEAADRSPPPSRKSLRVLLAEDTPANQKLMTVLLRRAGHRVELASDGLEAVAMFERGGFDAILMDVQMPKVDGFEATRRIRVAETHTGTRIPIIALSAHAMHGFREQCLDAGMDDYMAKPFTGSELDGILMAVTSEGRQRRQDDSSMGSGDGFAPASPPDDAHFSDEILARFLADFDELLTQARTAVEGSDAAELERAAHSLRGSSAFIRADAVTAAASTLEELGKDGSLDGAAEAVETLSHALDALRRSLGQQSRA